MWFKLANAKFTNHLGNIDKLSNSWPITYDLSFGLSRGESKFTVTKGESITITLIISEGFTYNDDLTVTIGGNTSTITPNINGNEISFTLADVAGPVTIKASATKQSSGGDNPGDGEVTPTNYTITYKYMCNGSPIKSQTTQTVDANSTQTFSTSDSRAQVSGYTCISVEPSGQQTINSNITVIYYYSINPESGSIQLTPSNAAFTTTDYHLAATNPGGPLVTSTQGTKGVMAWDIPAKALVTLTCSPNGNYGMAMTNSDGTKALETLVNSSVAVDGQNGTYTFSPVLEASRLYVSTTKFVSANYVILNDEELKQYDFNVTFEFTSDKANGKYINTSQTVGTDVKFADMGNNQYAISNTIPANSVITLNVKTGGSYGMCIADENGKVLQNKPSGQADADGNIVFDKQSVPCKLWVSITKYNKATYKLGG